MRMFVTCDIDSESKVDSVVYEMLNAGLVQYFEEKNYGGEFRGIAAVLMCRSPEIEFKRRVRYSKSDQHIYMDIMLNYQNMVSANQEDRRREVARRLLSEVPEVLSKYKIEGFDKAEFLGDFRKWIGGLGWL